MTEAETFLSRWSRLKHQAAPAENTPSSETRGTAVAHRNELSVAPPETEAPIFQDPNPANLPSIETITVDTDIRAFLQSGVSAELTRAALRRAWVSDPAIRDFIGIAENQWDFTDPTAIPGFGPLLETDDIPSLVAQALGDIHTPLETLNETALIARYEDTLDGSETTERSTSSPSLLVPAVDT
jgi:hypothetical protein